MFWMFTKTQELNEVLMPRAACRKKQEEEQRKKDMLFQQNKMAFQQKKAAARPQAMSNPLDNLMSGVSSWVGGGGG
jgi:hypothetical protein